MELRTALRISEQENPSAEQSDSYEHAARGWTARVDQDLLVGDGFDDDGYFLAARVVLGVVRTPPVPESSSHATPSWSASSPLGSLGSRFSTA